MFQLTDDDLTQVKDSLARLEGPVFAAIAATPTVADNVMSVGPYQITSQPFVLDINPNSRVFMLRNEQGGIGDYLMLSMAIEALAADAVRQFLNTPST